MNFLPEPKRTLWTLILPPAIWALHFLACYVAAAVHCAKPDLFAADFGTLRILIGAMTAAALALIAVSGILAWRQAGAGLYDPPHAGDTPQDRHRFLGFAILLLAGLSFVAVIFTALPAIFIESCRQ